MSLCYSLFLSFLFFCFCPWCVFTIFDNPSLSDSSFSAISLDAAASSWSLFSSLTRYIIEFGLADETKNYDGALLNVVVDFSNGAAEVIFSIGTVAWSLPPLLCFSMSMTRCDRVMMEGITSYCIMFCWLIICAFDFCLSSSLAIFASRSLILSAC